MIFAKQSKPFRDGGVVAHACEGVWGLACDPWLEQAIHKILSIKQREPSKGLIVIGHSSSVFSPELDELSPHMAETIRASWPSHLTWIVPSNRFSNAITGGRATVAARVPEHEQARIFCEMCHSPLVSTSANKSNQAPAVTQTQVEDCLGSLVDYILPGSVGKKKGFE